MRDTLLICAGILTGANVALSGVVIGFLIATSW